MFNELINQLEDNMLSLKNINYYCKHKLINMNDNNKIINNIKKKVDINNDNELYKIKYKDSLFWCFYILKNGYSNYEINVENKQFIIEKEEKYKYVSILRNKKDLLKLHKIKPLTDLEDELANKEMINIKTFIALCLVENINIFIIDNRKCFELIIDDKNNINIIHKEYNTNKYYIETKNDINKIKFYKNNYLLMDNLDNKLKSINSYRLDELIDMCKRLDIYNNQKTKKELYEILTLKFR
jgi:hypothetical protein